MLAAFCLPPNACSSSGFRDNLVPTSSEAVLCAWSDDDQLSTGSGSASRRSAVQCWGFGVGLSFACFSGPTTAAKHVTVLFRVWNVKYIQILGLPTSHFDNIIWNALFAPLSLPYLHFYTPHFPFLFLLYPIPSPNFNQAIKYREESTGEGSALIQLHMLHMLPQQRCASQTGLAFRLGHSASRHSWILACSHT